MRKRIILFNQTGDLTLSWEESDDQKMLEMIQSKMDQGFTFFRIKKNIFGNEKTKKLKKIDQLQDRKVILKDEEAERFFASSKTAEVETTPDATIEIEGKLETPQEVLNSESSAATPPVVGG